MSKRDRKRKTLDLPTDLLEWFETRAGRNQRTLTGQLIVDMDGFRERTDRNDQRLAEVELQTK